MVVAAMRRLDIADRPVDAFLGGGVITAGHPLLMDSIDVVRSEAAPLARSRIVTAPPIVGAGLLGLDHIGPGSNAAARLRAFYA